MRSHRFDQGMRVGETAGPALRDDGELDLVSELLRDFPDDVLDIPAQAADDADLFRCGSRNEGWRWWAACRRKCPR